MIGTMVAVGLAQPCLGRGGAMINIETVESGRVRAGPGGSGRARGGRAGGPGGHRVSRHREKGEPMAITASRGPWDRAGRDGAGMSWPQRYKCESCQF